MTNTPSATDLAISLIQCPSVTPNEGGALAFLDRVLSPLGFEVHRPTFSEEGYPDVENLFAKISEGDGPHLTFAGHIDVVPTGDESLWSLPPFGGEIKDGMLYGRGAADMKGGVAAFVAAVLKFIERHGEPKGTVSFLLTGDEEGPARNGTVKLLKWCSERGERFSDCVLGEPTNPDKLGEMIKVGRRGSQSGTLTLVGNQGHVAYPHLAHNPLPVLARIVEHVSKTPLDHGTDFFQPSNLEFISLDTGNQTWNLIPKAATARFNVRFNDLWDAQKLEAFVLAEAEKCLPSDDFKLSIAVEPDGSEAFLTKSDLLINRFSDAVKSVTGMTPGKSTDGGTSDARFIKDYCPVIEFGPVGKTMHMIDEHVAVEDLERLCDVYYEFLVNYFLLKGEK
ncbi:succinyl-diaminopimelate desuccinylase [uncultured Cohaesibacter sp.]|uniref:succinyl-diaminopimelate desuccinylase n=1 Tax=uncultured Cohaesibacter sp. TaxID=1002546 RepID=UPI002930A410|nr:succinyl-diaminopimelate desuccinylase [uncultured Cohaesibacter sp.]